MVWIKKLALPLAVMAMLTGGALAVHAADEAAPEKTAKTLEQILDDLKGEEPRMAVGEVEKLAGAGNIKAQLLLGDFYMKGEYVRANYSLAWKWYKRAAAKKSAEAMFKFAELHRLGQGTPFNLKKAVEWHTRAAKLDHVGAQRMLGLIYAGRFGGAAKNRGKAAEWLTRAAENDDLEAQQTLDDLYASGFVKAPRPDQAEIDPNSETGKIHIAVLGGLEKAASTLGTMALRGQLKVNKQDDGWFVVSVPRLNVTNPQGLKAVLGSSTIKIKPEDGGAYRTVVAPPLRVVVNSENNGPTYIFTYKQKRFSGMWRPEINSFSESDIELADLKIESPEKAMTVTAERLINTSNMKEDPPGAWGGPAFLEIEAITITGAKDNTLMTLKSVVAKNQYEGFNVAAIKEQIEDFSASRDQTPFPQAPPAGTILSLSASTDMTLSGLEAFEEDGTPAVALSSLSFLLGMGVDMPHASFSAAYKHQGLESDAIPELKTFLPHDASVSVNVERVPIQASFKTVFALLLRGMFEQPLATGVGPVFPDPSEIISAMRGPLDEAKTQINITVKLDAAKAALELDGLLRADTKSIHGVSGGGDIIVKGLDGILETMAKDPERVMEALMLSSVADLAKTETADDGTKLATFRLDMTADGKFLVNGKDVTEMPGGGEGKTHL